MCQHGLPGRLYVDRDSIYRCEGVASIAEQLAGKPPLTQFGRAMEQLGIKLILVNSPQAKGRVERMNRTLQDRLVKELRLAGVNDLESANTFLDGKSLKAFHRQFARTAASPVDVHRAVPRNLNEACLSGWLPKSGMGMERGGARSDSRSMESGAAAGLRHSRAP